jgi:hypothetical protein
MVEVMAKAQHFHDYLALLQNQDPAIQATALEMALNDPDPAVRGLAMSAYLKRFSALSPQVQLDADSPVAKKDIPRLSIVGANWSSDGASFAGYYSTTCSGPVGVRGQIAGGKLALSYDGVCIRPALISSASGSNPADADKQQLVACQVTLAPDASKTSLDGFLQCAGVDATLPVKLPFGP